MSDTKRGKIGRPKTRTAPVPIKLSLEKTEKRRLQKMAFDLNISASQLVGNWITKYAEESR